MISVIVPCYNIDAYVERCVRSILAQDIQETLEILLIDDGSTDQTGKVCERLASSDDRIRTFHQENGGPGIARNTGIENARGEFLAFADGDDRMLPQMLRVLREALVRTGSQIAVCPYFYVEEGTEIPKEDNRENAVISIQELSPDEALHYLVVEDEEQGVPVIQNAAWNKLYRREIFKGIRYPAGRYEDILTMARVLAAAEKVCYVDRKLYAYTGNRGSSIMNGSELESILTEQIPAYRARNAFFEEIEKTDLIPMGDYLIGKKLLILYTQGRRQPDGRPFARELARVIREWFGPRFREIYSCPIAGRHHALRMRLFLIHPALYNIFTALNERIVLPIRRAVSGRRERA